MIRKSFVVVIEDYGWPQISCCMMHLNMTDALIDVVLKQNVGASSTESLYDTAQTNFEVHVRNALGQAMRELFNDRKGTPKEGMETPAQRVAHAQRIPVPEAGAPVPPPTGSGSTNSDAEKTGRLQEGVVRKTKPKKKGGR